MTDNVAHPSQLFRITRLCLMLLGCVCLGVGGGYFLKFSMGHSGGIKFMAMAALILAVSAFGIVQTLREIVRKQK